VTSRVPAQVKECLDRARRLWFFLDYDGTLADLAPTPDHVHPDPEVVELLGGLVQVPHVRVAVISGRRLGHVETLVPVPGVLLAGTYGIELQTPAGERINRLAYDVIRPALDILKPRWSEMVAGRHGFFVEDKGWALALHARFAEDDEADAVLSAARREATDVISQEVFCLLGGHKFLEVAPKLAHKGRTVAYLLDRYAWPGAVPVYLGDDDKDEAAFDVIQGRGGIAGLVAREPRDVGADFWLESPQAVRRWLRRVLERVAMRGRSN